MELGIKWLIVVDHWIYGTYDSYKSANEVRKNLRESAEIVALFPNGHILREYEIRRI